MQTRTLGPFDVSAIGLGCMSLSHAYGTPPDAKTAAAVLLKALDLGYTHIDSAALYGFGANETLIGNVLSGRRREFVLATKGGMFRNAQGQREIDGRPEMIRRNCEESLQRLQTDVIDLYYLHRWDKRVPIEDSVGALADLVKEGKVRTIGLSRSVGDDDSQGARACIRSRRFRRSTRCGRATPRSPCSTRAASSASRSSRSARSRAASSAVSCATCRRCLPKDIRLGMPRFQPEHFAKNLPLLDGLSARRSASKAARWRRLALAWVLAQGPHIIPIPGTTRLDHLEENAGAEQVRLSPAAMQRD